jgi:hypothetical protein
MELGAVGSEAFEHGLAARGPEVEDDNYNRPASTVSATLATGTSGFAIAFDKNDNGFIGSGLAGRGSWRCRRHWFDLTDGTRDPFERSRMYPDEGLRIESFFLCPLLFSDGSVIRLVPREPQWISGARHEPMADR